MFRLTDKVVFLTGCGSVGPGWGNGKSIAVLFARQGARIFGVDINEAAARETQAIITGEGGTCEVATGDVTDSAQVARLVEACMARFSRIDVLVNNVGKSEPAIPGEMDEALWDSQLAVNLKSAFLCCHAVLPIMQKQGMLLLRGLLDALQSTGRQSFESPSTSSARFSSRTGPKPKNGPRFFEDFKGICEGDRTSETGEGPKIGL